MSTLSNTSPIEQALKVAQEELSNARATYKNDNNDHNNNHNNNTQSADDSRKSEDKAKNSSSSANYTNEDDGIDSPQLDFHNYYTRYQQPKNEIPYNDWILLFPDLDLIHGNFKGDNNEISEKSHMNSKYDTTEEPKSNQNDVHGNF